METSNGEAEVGQEYTMDGRESKAAACTVGDDGKKKMSKEAARAALLSKFDFNAA